MADQKNYSPSGLNELFPLDPSQWEDQNPMSLAPVAFKQGFQPGQVSFWNGWDWAIPGALRGGLNDAWIAATSPYNAFMGKLTPQQMHEAAMRGVSGVMGASSLASAPEGVLASGFAGGKGVKLNPDAKREKNLWNEFTQAYMNMSDLWSVHPGNIGKKGTKIELKGLGHDEPYTPSSPIFTQPLEELQKAHDAYHDFAGWNIENPQYGKDIDEFVKNKAAAAKPKEKDPFEQVPWEPDVPEKEPGVHYPGFGDEDTAHAALIQKYGELKDFMTVNPWINLDPKSLEKGQVPKLWDSTFKEEYVPKAGYGKGVFADFQNAYSKYNEAIGGLNSYADGNQILEELDWHHANGKGMFAAPAKSTSKPGTVASKSVEAQWLENHPKEKMRDYTPSELDWEYNKEYLEYGKHALPDNAFTSRGDFQQKFDAAPLVHLSKRDFMNLNYSTAMSYLAMGADKGGPQALGRLQDSFGHRRDVGRIKTDLLEGQTAPPIVVRWEDEYGDTQTRLLAGNTRLSVGAAHGLNVPVKMIDLRKGQGADLTPPLNKEESAANFAKWFEGSQAVDENGKPLMFVHATGAHNLEAFDPQKNQVHSGGARNFFSVTSNPEFANNWTGGKSGPRTHYPLLVSAKNPGDFRKPEHVEKALNWLKANKYKDYMADGYSTADAEHYAAQYIKDAKHGVENGHWDYWENPEMWNALGWDGAFMKENVEDKTLNMAIPKPSQLKSIFNKGTWNPNDPRILHSGGSFLGGALAPMFTAVDHDPWSEEYKTKVREKESAKKKRSGK